MASGAAELEAKPMVEVLKFARMKYCFIRYTLVSSLKDEYKLDTRSPHTERVSFLLADSP